MLVVFTACTPSETNGISSIKKTSSEGLVDTYTIYYTDGSKEQFTVTNGEQGIQGIQGEKGEDGRSPIITIQNGNWYIDGVDTGKRAEGIQGETGNGISSIAKTKTEGLVDTYTITYTNGTTSVFEVTNGKNGEDGKDGEQGIQGIQGEKGEDGHSPIITIQNGNWYIDGVDTGKRAEGIQGETGNGIASIERTKTIGLVSTYTITYTNGKTNIFTVTNGEKGEQGIQGIQGEKGEDGHSPIITIQNGNWYIDGVDTGKSAEGVAGEAGNGISSIRKTNTEGFVDTYTITFTNGETSTFTVTNGEKGEQGIQGIQGEKGEDGHSPIITIQNGNWYIDGLDTYQKAIGVDGETGNGISSIDKTHTDGLVDIYTITYTNGTISSFTVTNGEKGEQGIQGIQGEKGEDGHSPIITIQNGNWYIDGVDTGKSAEGVAGEAGNGISSIRKTNTEGFVDTYTITFTNGETSTFTVTNGEKGEQGVQGETGNSVTGTYVDDDYNLWVSFSNGDKVNAGYLGPKYTVTFVDYDGVTLATFTGVKYKESVSAPSTPQREGYVFIGWDKEFNSVTENLTIRAQYSIEEVAERNQLCYTFKDNKDGTTTARLLVRGDVNLYGLEMKLRIDAEGMSFDSVASSISGLLAYYNGEYIMVSFVNTSGTDLTQPSELLTIVFNNDLDVRTVGITTYDVDVFDDEYNDESYSIFGNEYEN